MRDVIGVAGCGRMGAGMLANLQKAGFVAHGFDIRPVPGTTQDVGTFSKDLNILITVVRDAAQTDALLFDEQAIIPQAQDLHTIIIASTLSPKYVKNLRNRVPYTIKLIDAPMSGAKVKADAGTLTFITGGDIDAVRPLLQAMGSHIHHMGDYGSGMTAKVLNNMLAASHTAMTRLVLDWADQTGIDESKLLDVIQNASGQNWFASGFETIEFARDGYANDNTMGILVKDVAAALDLAIDNDSTLPHHIMQTLQKLTPRRKP